MHHPTLNSKILEDVVPGQLPTLPIVKIEPVVEWMRFCRNCEGEQRFVADRVCAHGLIGNCTRCGDEFIATFTRTTWAAS